MKKHKIWQWFEDHMSPCIVVLSFVLVLTFTIVDMVLAGFGIVISNTIEEWFYKFFGLEMIAISNIKIGKHVTRAVMNHKQIIDECVDDSEEDSDETEA